LHRVVLLTKKKKHNRTLLFSSTPSSTVTFWLLKPASENTHARLLPRLSWSLTVQQNAYLR
jgi:hypothetical protein